MSLVSTTAGEPDALPRRKVILQTKGSDSTELKGAERLLNPSSPEKRQKRSIRPPQCPEPTIFFAGVAPDEVSHRRGLISCRREAGSSKAGRSHCRAPLILPLRVPSSRERVEETGF